MPTLYFASASSDLITLRRNVLRRIQTLRRRGLDQTRVIERFRYYAKLLGDEFMQQLDTPGGEKQLCAEYGVEVAVQRAADDVQHSATVPQAASGRKRPSRGRKAGPRPVQSAKRENSWSFVYFDPWGRGFVDLYPDWLASMLANRSQLKNIGN
jgi:hypothetical protein